MNTNDIQIDFCPGWKWPMYTLTYNLPNRDIVQMRFQVDNGDPYMVNEKDYRWWVMLYIGPRQNRDINVDGIQTGHCGLTGLGVALEMLKYFMENYTKVGQYIVVNGADGRRFRIYKHYLSRMGFRETRYCGIRVMMLKIA